MEPLGISPIKFLSDLISKYPECNGDLTLINLKDSLEKAVMEERYEDAIKLRDEINAYDTK